MYVLHPWHGAHYGDKSPAVVNALIEIPQGSKTKYEIDKTTGLLKLDRVIIPHFIIPLIMVSFHKRLEKMVTRWIF